MRTRIEIATTCTALVCLLAVSAAAQRKGEQYTLVVPAESLKDEGYDWTNTHRVYAVDTQDAAGPGALPTVLELRFEKKNGEEIEFRTQGTWVKLRFRDESDMMERIGRYAVPSNETDALVDAVLDGAAAAVFTGTELEKELWRDLARYAFSLGGVVLQPPTTFRGGDYLTVSLGRWDSIYNTRRLNQAQRLALVIGELLDRVKGAEALADVGFSGLRLDLQIPFRDFVDSSGSGTDALTWYIESSLITELRDFEITSQDFVDGSVVVVDGTRVEVDLSDQG